MFGVTILGNNSAIPAYDRHPTAQVVTMQDQLLLLDCGEGTQLQITKYKIRRSKINYIFISHLHGDHYFGLLGLITSFGLLGREHDLHLFGPPTLEKILPFQLYFHPLEREERIVDEKRFTVDCFATKHRVTCWGFIIKEKKPPRKINPDAVKKFQIPVQFYENLKNGEDYITDDNSLIKNEWVTFENSTEKSYAYCADTSYDESLAEKIKYTKVIYHETTYLKEFTSLAALRFHATTIEAATIAKLAETEKLLIGHFSSKYECLDPFLEEATAVFPNTELAIEGVTFKF
ncbi:MAG: ribonuclease Z [Chitinophagaceae bacterium]